MSPTYRQISCPENVVKMTQTWLRKLTCETHEKGEKRRETSSLNTWRSNYFEDRKQLATLLCRLDSSIVSSDCFSMFFFFWDRTRILCFRLLGSAHAQMFVPICRGCCSCPRTLGWWRFLLPTAPTTWAVESACCPGIRTAPGPAGCAETSGWRHLTGERCSDSTAKFSEVITRIQMTVFMEA